MVKTDTIGGFPYAEPDCKGCGKPLLLENSMVTDGCGCNTPLGINSMNETRWRLLMTYTQNLQWAQERLRKENDVLREAMHPRPETKGTSPLLLYFTDADERTEFVEAYRQVHPNAKSYNV